MQAICCTDKKKLEYTDMPMPVLDNTKDELLLRINAVGICGSDIHTYNGNNPMIEYPRVMGHELSATIYQASESYSGELAVGDKVTVMPYFSCGVCGACIRGRRTACRSLKVLGVHIDGGMTEYIKVPAEYVFKVDGSFSDETIAMIEPLAISEHAVARANVQDNDLVLVLGAGPIGLGAMMMAKLRTKQVIAADIDDSRLAFCKEYIGIEKTINPKEGLEQAVLTATDGQLPSVIIDATGNQYSMNGTVSVLENGGRIVFVGYHANEIRVNDMDFHKRETSLLGSRAADKGDFKRIIQSVTKGSIDPSLLVTHQVEAGAFIERFVNEWTRPESKIIKGVIRMFE